MVILFIACPLLALSVTVYCNLKIASKTADDFVTCLSFWNSGHFVWMKIQWRIHWTVGTDKFSKMAECQTGYFRL
jgi:hypothetical protein